MKKLLLLLLLYIPFLGFTQERVLRKNLTEKFVRFADSKGGYYECYYNENLFTGTSVSYYKNGQLQEEVSYKNGLKDGLEQRWLTNGQLGKYINYKNGLRHGLDRQWYIDGQLEWEENYKNGLRHGFRKKWHENGQLEVLEDYIDGKKISAKRFDKEGNEEHIPIDGEMNK